ncbi:MAG: DUF5597 domain-containing protein [Faecousia sp.]
MQIPRLTKQGSKTVLTVDGKPFTMVQGFLFGMDVTDPALKTPQNYEEYGLTGRNLQGLMPFLTEKLGTGDLQATCGENGDQGMMTFGDLRVITAFRSQMQPRNDGYCLCVMAGENELYVMGNACSVMLMSADSHKANLDLLLVEEVSFGEKGSPVVGRRLNGDETAMALKFESPGVLHIRYFVYE